MGVAQSSFECCVERDRDLPPYGNPEKMDRLVEESINTEIVNLYMQCNLERGSLIETKKELMQMMTILKKWGYHLHAWDIWVTSKTQAAQTQRGSLHLTLREFRYWFRGQIVADDFNRSLLFQRTGCSKRDGDIHTGLKTTVNETSPKPGVYSSQIDSSSNAHIVRQRSPQRRSHAAMRKSGRV
jgi:hypothetical protein